MTRISYISPYALVTVALICGCSHTVYDLFPGSSDPVGTGGGCEVGDCGSGDTDPYNYGDGDGDSTGLPGGASGEDHNKCEPTLLTGQPLYAVRFAQSGKCILQGEPTLIGTDPANLIVTGECSQAREALWVVLADNYNALQFRNEASNLNLDVRYAAPTSGTPLVLFEPHALYNQRFLRTQESDTRFKLSPRHAEQQCLTEVQGGVEIWPCNPTATTQQLELLDCAALNP